MTLPIIQVAGGAIVDKDPSQAATYTIDLTAEIAPGDSISAAAWSADNDLTVAASWNDNTTASLRLSAGSPGYGTVRLLATTVNGDTLVSSFQVHVTNPSAFGSGIVSCFPSLVAAVASIRRDRLMTAAGTYFPDEVLTDDYLLEKLVATEADIQRQLRVFLTPREVMPMNTDPSVISASQQAGNTVLLEPGYDYDPAIFQGNRWGLIELRQKPISAVRSITFSYPAPTDTLFTIPSEWIRYEPRYGRINLVPVQTAISLPLNAFILSALGGGRTVPLMLQVAYRCGMENAAVDFPDVLDVVKKATVLSIIDDRYVPASGSVSQDGLSQSVSMDSSKYQEAIDRKIEKLKQYLHGPRLMVM